jgi:hypothetical protein
LQSGKMVLVQREPQQKRKISNDFDRSSAHPRFSKGEQRLIRNLLELAHGPSRVSCDFSQHTEGTTIAIHVLVIL